LLQTTALQQSILQRTAVIRSVCERLHSICQA
jgi:hypothetical protein